MAAVNALLENGANRALQNSSSEMAFELASETRVQRALASAVQLLAVGISGEVDDDEFKEMVLLGIE